MTRTQNAVRNISWALVQRMVTLAVPFASRTVLIKVLGMEYLGLSSYFTSVLGLLSLAELGISSAIISSMYKPIAEEDTKTICALMNLIRKAYNVIGVAILVIGIGIMPFVPKLIKGEPPGDVNIFILYAVYLINTAVSYFLFAYKNCLFIAHQRNDVNSRVQTLCIVLQNVLQILLVCTFKNYYVYVCIIPLFSILANVITAELAKKEYPEYVSKGDLEGKLKRDVKARVAGLFLARAAGTIRSSIDSMFITAFLGLEMGAMYSNYFYIVTAVAGMIQIIETSLVAGVGNSISTETREKNYNDFIKFTFILQWIVGWCAICILCLEQHFMKIWMGEKYLFKESMVVLCAVYLFVNCICIVRSIYTQALGMWWSLKVLSVVDIFTNIFLNYHLGKHFGAYGIIGASIIDILLVSIPWTTYYLCRDYFGKEHFANYIKDYIKYFVVATFVGSITYAICVLVPTNFTLLSFVLKGVICIIVPNCLYCLIFLKSKLFKESKNMFLNLIALRRKNR